MNSDKTAQELRRLQSSAQTMAAQNQRLVRTLKEARSELVTLKADIDRLSSPPISFGTVLKFYPQDPLASRSPAGTASNNDAHADILHQGRKIRVLVAADLTDTSLRPGTQVLVNDALNVIGVAPADFTGDIAVIREVISPQRAMIDTANDAQKIVRIGPEINPGLLHPGDTVMVDLRALVALEHIHTADVTDLVLEHIPDISYEDIGGLAAQIEQIQDAVELPFLHRDLYQAHQLQPPKGVLLYGPPGCGKTLIAKAVAASLARKVAKQQRVESSGSYFLNIKGPELLNKFVGETERHIRRIFQRAREIAHDGSPVVVFFDEMDSLFRTRGSGVSSDVETTIVPQLLAEIDGVESLENVIVIGASNREDMIDPAILRPGRLDVKIRINRPNKAAATDIFSKYLTPELPLNTEELAAHGNDPTLAIAAIITGTVNAMYAKTSANEMVELTYADGVKEILYYADLASGAMIANIVDRAKKMAIKAHINGREPGLRPIYFLDAMAAEFAENEDMPGAANPEEWARITGRKGGKVAAIRNIAALRNAQKSAMPAD